jgi:chemotaxis protein methyltransferase CheR
MEQSFERILQHLQSALGLDLTGYRRETLRRRLAARLEQVGAPDLETYLVRLRSDTGECDRLVNALAVHVSSFFRDPVVFEVLEQGVLPQIVERKKREGGRDLRVWSAGCATGEEAYSLAILIDRVLKSASAEVLPLVFATDVNLEVLRRAEKGVYERAQLENAKLGVVDRYFLEKGGRFEVVPDIRKVVRFSQDDLTKPGLLAPAESIFGGFDLVACRNLLIYFSKKLQESVIEKLCGSLVPGGFLVLGASEHLWGSAAGHLDVIDRKNRIYQKKKRPNP